MEKIMMKKENNIIKYVLITISFLFVFTMLLLPLASIILNSLQKGWKFYFSSITDKNVLSALKVTIIATVSAVLVNTVFGVTVAWLITKFSFRGKNILATLIDIPFSISPVIAGLAFIMTFGRMGWANSRSNSCYNLCHISVYCKRNYSDFECTRKS